MTKSERRRLLRSIPATDRRQRKKKHKPQKRQPARQVWPSCRVCHRLLDSPERLRGVCTYCAERALEAAPPPAEDVLAYDYDDLDDQESGDGRKDP